MYNHLPLAFRTFSYEPKRKTVFSQDASGSHPTYTLRKNEHAKSNIQISRIAVDRFGVPQPFDIGSIQLHTYSSKVDISLHNGSATMRSNTLSNLYTFDWAPYGTLQWKTNFSGSKMELYDKEGRVLATMKIKTKSTLIQILVPGDDFFVDLVVFSGIANMKQSGKNADDAGTASDIISAVVGA